MMIKYFGLDKIVQLSAVFAVVSVALMSSAGANENTGFDEDAVLCSGASNCPKPRADFVVRGPGDPVCFIRRASNASGQLPGQGTPAQVVADGVRCASQTYDAINRSCGSGVPTNLHAASIPFIYLGATFNATAYYCRPETAGRTAVTCFVERPAGVTTGAQASDITQCVNNPRPSPICSAAATPNEALIDLAPQTFPMGTTDYNISAYQCLADVSCFVMRSLPTSTQGAEMADLTTCMTPATLQTTPACNTAPFTDLQHIGTEQTFSSGALTYRIRAYRCARAPGTSVPQATSVSTGLGPVTDQIDIQHTLLDAADFNAFGRPVRRTPPVPSTPETPVVKITRVGPTDCSLEGNRNAPQCLSAVERRNDFGPKREESKNESRKYSRKVTKKSTSNVETTAPDAGSRSTTTKRVVTRKTTERRIVARRPKPRPTRTKVRRVSAVQNTPKATTADELFKDEPQVEVTVNGQKQKVAPVAAPSRTVVTVNGQPREVATLTAGNALARSRSNSQSFTSPLLLFAGESGSQSRLAAVAQDSFESRLKNDDSLVVCYGKNAEGRTTRRLAEETCPEGTTRALEGANLASKSKKLSDTDAKRSALVLDAISEDNTQGKTSEKVQGIRAVVPADSEYGVKAGLYTLGFGRTASTRAKSDGDFSTVKSESKAFGGSAGFFLRPVLPVSIGLGGILVLGEVKSDITGSNNTLDTKQTGYGGIANLSYNGGNIDVAAKASVLYVKNKTKVSNLAAETKHDDITAVGKIKAGYNIFGEIPGGTGGVKPFVGASFIYAATKEGLVNTSAGLVNAEDANGFGLNFDAGLTLSSTVVAPDNSEFQSEITGSVSVPVKKLELESNGVNESTQVLTGLKRTDNGELNYVIAPKFSLFFDKNTSISAGYTGRFSRYTRSHAANGQVSITF